MSKVTMDDLLNASTTEVQAKTYKILKNQLASERDELLRQIKVRDAKIAKLKNIIKLLTA